MRADAPNLNNMKNERSETGRKGETAACAYLEEMGQRILFRNWRHSHQEIDIISLGSDGIHIVEVKTRNAPAMVEPLLNIDGMKRRSLARAARAFLNSEDRKTVPGGDFDISFDFISVIVNGKDIVEINYYPRAFSPTNAHIFQHTI